MGLSRRVRLASMALLLLGLTGSALAQEATPLPEQFVVYPPDTVVFGATLGEWSARHWQWTLSFPVGRNPGHDATGESCGCGQSGPVFYVPRNLPPCTVPSGMALFIPVAGTECSTVESEPFVGLGEADLRACAATEAERYTAITVSVDGQTVPDIETYRAASPPFAIALPPSNVLGVPAGVGWAIADGYQVMVAPLPVGDHEIVVHLELTDGTVLPDKVLSISVRGPVGSEPAGIPTVDSLLATPLATPPVPLLASPWPDDPSA